MFKIYAKKLVKKNEKLVAEYTPAFENELAEYGKGEKNTSRINKFYTQVLNDIYRTEKKKANLGKKNPELAGINYPSDYQMFAEHESLKILEDGRKSYRSKLIKKSEDYKKLSPFRGPLTLAIGSGLGLLAALLTSDFNFTYIGVALAMPEIIIEETVADTLFKEKSSSKINILKNLGIEERTK